MHHAAAMKTTSLTLLALGAFALGVTSGCATSTDEPEARSDQDVSLSVVSTTPSPSALAGTHARMELTGVSTVMIFIYADPQPAVRSNIAGVAEGSVLRDQVVDLVNPGTAHRFGLHDVGGQKVAQVDVPARATLALQLRRAGAYTLRCEDCVTLSAESAAAKDWAGFVEVLNAGNAFAPARVTLPIRVVDREP
jgi:hypothetical protein